MNMLYSTPKGKQIPKTDFDMLVGHRRASESLPFLLELGCLEEMIGKLYKWTGKTNFVGYT